MPPSVTHNQAQHRFEVELGDEKGLLEYAIKGNQIDLHHLRFHQVINIKVWEKGLCERRSITHAKRD